MVYHLIMDCANTESVQSKLSVKGNTTRKPTNLIVLKYQIPVNAISREPDEPFPHDNFFYYIGICFTWCQVWVGQISLVDSETNDIGVVQGKSLNACWNHKTGKP